MDKIDTEKMNIRWRLSEEDITVFPVSFYTKDITVAPRDGGSEVTWHASLYRADTTNEPAEEYNDEAAVKAMEAFINHGLAGITARPGDSGVLPAYPPHFASDAARSASSRAAACKVSPAAAAAQARRMARTPAAGPFGWPWMPPPPRYIRSSVLPVR